MPTLHDFDLTAINGAPLPLAQFAGKVVLLVNTASACGYTPQYEDLEALWQARKGEGLVVVGVPSNDFGAQELGSNDDVASFCKLNYGVTFPLAAKTVVKGKAAHPLYQWIVEQAGSEAAPAWNFHKYLFGRDGSYLGFFSAQTKPLGPKITQALASALK
ncbi:MAG: glutathione peroxidase [Proteobacteria bacterium]|nr:glutathione peroxidase [Pseudomonadota bacterium]